jgi:hypothetical protein
LAERGPSRADVQAAIRQGRRSPAGWYRPQATENAAGRRLGSAQQGWRFAKPN